MTSLTLYTGDTATGTLASAASLVTASGGTSVTHSTALGTATGYGEIVFLATTNAWGAFGSIQSPTGNGALWDVTTLEAQTLASGTFTFKFVLALTASTSIVADIIGRLYKRSSGGVYTAIGSATLTAQTITTTLTTFSPSTSFSSMAFSTGDKLYLDLWLNVTTNTNGNGALKVKAQMGTGTTGVVGSNEIDTQGYSATPAASHGGTFALMGVG